MIWVFSQSLRFLDLSRLLENMSCSATASVSCGGGVFFLRVQRLTSLFGSL